jgi:hypothetical protein
MELHYGITGDHAIHAGSEKYVIETAEFLLRPTLIIRPNGTVGLLSPPPHDWEEAIPEANALYHLICEAYGASWERATSDFLYWPEVHVYKSPKGNVLRATFLICRAKEMDSPWTPMRVGEFVDSWIEGLGAWKLVQAPHGIGEGIIFEDGHRMEPWEVSVVKER